MIYYKLQSHYFQFLILSCRPLNVLDLISRMKCEVFIKQYFKLPGAQLNILVDFPQYFYFIEIIYCCSVNYDFQKYSCFNKLFTHQFQDLERKKIKFILERRKSIIHISIQNDYTCNNLDNIFFRHFILLRIIIPVPSQQIYNHTTKYYYYSYQQER